MHDRLQRLHPPTRAVRPAPLSMSQRSNILEKQALEQKVPEQRSARELVGIERNV